MNSKRVKAFDKTLLTMHKAHATGPHIYLEVVAVDPACQRAGVGRKMMQAVHAIADAMGLPCYLETDNEGVFKKFGYETAGTEDLIEGFDKWLGGMRAMRREPVKKVKDTE